MGRTAENMKGHQKAERKIKELAFQNDEDKKNQVAMSDLLVSCSPRSRPTRSRLRRLRRSPPSTWLSSGRLSRSLRRQRTVLGSLSLPSSTKIPTLPKKKDQGFEQTFRASFLATLALLFCFHAYHTLSTLSIEKHKKNYIVFQNYYFIVIESF